MFFVSRRPRLSRTIILFSFSSSRAMPFVRHSRFEAELKGKKIKDWTDKRTMTLPSLSLWLRLLFAFSARRRSTADNEAIHLYFSVPHWDHLRVGITWWRSPGTQSIWSTPKVNSKAESKKDSMCIVRYIFLLSWTIKDKGLFILPIDDRKKKQKLVFAMWLNNWFYPVGSGELTSVRGNQNPKKNWIFHNSAETQTHIEFKWIRTAATRH